MRYLGEAEQQILFDLERLARRRPLLLIADNLQWWDAASLTFLGRLRESEMRDSFPFLAEMRVLAVETLAAYQPVVHVLARDRLIEEGGAATRTQVQRIDRDLFGSVLVAMRGEATPAPTVDTIYSFTGGHLALARQCVALLDQGDGEYFSNIASADAFVAGILSERIRGLGTIGAKAVEVMQIAALIGLRFRRDEVACVWQGDKGEALEILRFLRQEDLIELAGEAGWFVHELYRKHFLATGPIDRVALHERLRDCLRLLTPGAYEIRCQNAIGAQKPLEAASLAIQAGLSRLRNGEQWESLPDFAVDAIQEGGLESASISLRSTTHLLDEDRFEDALEELAHIDHGLPREVLAEADYLRAACLMSTRSERDQQNARAVLGAWGGLEASEPDLGVRLMQLHLYGLAMLEDKTAGRELEAKVKETLLERVSFDQVAKDQMYTLDRCSSSLYEPDVSLIRTRRAEEHFGPATPGDVVRRPIQYYRSLVNLSAELLVNARYEEAKHVCEKIEALVDDFAPGTFPRLEDPRSTAIIVQYRLGAIDAFTAAVEQELVVDQHASEEDPFYAKNLLGSFLALDSRFGEALAVFDQLVDRLRMLPSPEPSMEYLLRANRVSTQFVAGQRNGLLEEWSELLPLLQRVPYTITPVLLRRHEFFADVIASGDPLRPAEFDEAAIVDRRPEFGPMWDQLARGFRMPEVQWWH